MLKKSQINLREDFVFLCFGAGYEFLRSSDLMQKKHQISRFFVKIIKKRANWLIFL
jgi:xylose isomerase